MNRDVRIVKKDKSIHVVPEDFAKQLIKEKQAKLYSDKMIGAAPKSKAPAEKTEKKDEK